MTGFSHTGPRLAVSAGIFRDGKILLVRRAREPAKGVYTFPGGRVEFGESLHEALAREVREETGLEIEIVGLVGYREALPPRTGGHGHFVILPFAARWVANDVALNDELDDARWLSPQSAVDGLPVTHGLNDTIRAAAAMMGL
ncbi:MAG: NUDIX hydrolase [Afipia sp.]|jgi:ADP-ribose pyrophosphatase YjhB (NUDIX family)|nr:NUDIX hydrolase [Afipia sp.]MBS4002884.1 NUDIX hydrolase [Afipia sp.]WIG52300.1 MAG: GDP-mannose mannosyl hydrolase [Afipia sp.]